MGVPVAEGQNMESFDGIGDISRDLYNMHPSETPSLIWRLLEEGLMLRIYKGCWRGCQYHLRHEQWLVSETSRCRDMIEIYKRLEHENVVSFFGCSIIGKMSVLVLKLMPLDLRRMMDDPVRKFRDWRKQNFLTTQWP